MLASADGLRGAFNPAEPTGALIYAALFLVLAAVGTRVVRVIAHRGARHFPDPTATTFLAQLLQVVVVLAAVILYAHLIPALRAVGSALLTGASVLSIVLGLAAQNTLANLIAGIAILLYHPFRLGDQLEIATPKGVVTGTITSVTLGYTLLETRTAEEIVVPNSVMASAVIIRDKPQRPAR
jgi:small-conductance mechanosensitive channel